MATSIILHFFLLCLLLFSASSASNNELPKTGFITLPVNKDPTTHQYHTSIGLGTPKHTTNLAIDLSVGFLWYDCDNRYTSSSYHPVSCDDSQKCPQEYGCHDCSDSPPKPGCTSNTCSLLIPNQFIDIFFSGDWGEDLLHFPHTKVPRSFLSACTNSDVFTTPLLIGLAKGTKGILGLARSQRSLPIQISSSYNIPPKFTLCLPSSNSKGTGKIFIGGRPNAPASVVRIGFALSSSDGYFINVKSIVVDDKGVNFNNSLLSLDENGNGGTKISTLGTPYTLLHHSIYKPFVRDFVEKASARGIKRVKSVSPFGACFDADTIRDLDVGPAVPDIELVFDGGLKYEMFGHNTMVEVKEKVLCLAFVDGGEKANNAIVLGGLQLEDKILEFDLSTSILTFSSSLLLQGESCSDGVLI